MFRRKAYDKLMEWKRLSNGKTAALIEGARRIGKSTVVEAFAQAEYADYLLLDFTRESQDIRQNFVDNISDLDTFFRNLFLLKGKSLPAGDALIVFDEVQLFPFARQCIKELVRDGRFHYIETGSLLSIKSNTQNILLPSEEFKIKMYPMDFDEFLWARNDNITGDAIRDAFEKKKPLSDAVHRKIMKVFREYMAVGGMPQAVNAFVLGQTYEETDFVKRAILSLYEDDLHKFDSDERGRVSAIFKTIPQQLGTPSRHFKYSLIGVNERYQRLAPSIAFMMDSMIVNVCQNVTSPDVLMELYAERNNFKMYMGDTGLLVSQAISTDPQSNETLYKALVLDKLNANLGMVTENMVAQMLVAQGHELRFHEFKYQEDGQAREKSYEIDFLTVRGKRVCPIEVKSSSYKMHKSLDAFFKKYDTKSNERYVLYPKNLAREGNVVYLPLYMAMCL